MFVLSGRPNFNLIQQLILDEGQKPDQVLFDEVKSNLVDESDLDICSSLKSIVIECWKTNAKDRPSIKKVKSKLEPISKSVLNKPNEIARLKKTKTLSKSKKVLLSQFDFSFHLALKFIQSSSADFETSISMIYLKTIQVKYFAITKSKQLSASVIKIKHLRN